MRKISLCGLPVILLLVLALVVAAYPALVLADEEETPILCWGIVTIDGIAAEEGISVEIYLGDDTTLAANTTVSTHGGVDPPGTYGAVMVKAGSSRYGDPLTYKVNGIVANKIGPDEGVFGQKNQVVNLEAFGGSPPPDGGGGLSAGAVAGIAVGVLLAVAVIAWLIIRRKKGSGTASATPESV
jgi:hypothetical protein